MTPRALAALLVLLGARAVNAQQVMDTDASLVEVRGLVRWTVPMLVDSLARHAPGASLASHACAAVLRQKLGFPDAAVLVYPRGYEGRSRPEFYVTVVEPHDSARVRYLAPPTEARVALPEWRALATLMRGDFERYQESLRTYGTRAASAAGDTAGAEGGAHRAFDDALRAARGTGGAGAPGTAIATLRSARDAELRALAATVLVGWPGQDATWHALADALRDGSPLVRTVAGQSLRALTAGSPRRVDWRPASASLRALLDGTNLFAFDLVLDMLSATGDGARLRRPLLAGGGGLLLELLESREPAARVRAYRFLRAMSGTDRGVAPAPWRAWIATL